jgi:CheY-like chemotaxis protein
MTCLTGYFGYLDPQDGPEPSLAEALLRAESKGAVASLMPTGMTSTGGQHILDTALFESIFTKDIRQLGPAVIDAKQTLLANGGTAFEEISETFLLFGDPALTLQVPIPHKPSEVEVQQVEEGILISWQSVEDCDGNPVAGYNLYRSPSAGGIYTKVNGILITDTEYLDTDPAGISAQDVGGSGTGSYFYGVTSVDSGGDESAQSLAISPPSLATIPGAEDVGAASCFIDTSTSPAEFNITFKALIAIVSIILVFVLLQSIFDPSRKKNTAEKKMNPFNELKNVKTLLVDDDEFIRNSLELAFKTKGCCLKVAETAEEGLQAIKAHQFDIIISDFRLPGMNGLEFLKLAAVTQPQAVKFLITAYRDDHIFSEAVRLGVNEFIEKPFAVKVLINLLALALKRQEKTRSAIM